MDKKSRDIVMGKLYLKNKDYKMAEKSFLEYLNSSPEDFQALKMLAQVYEHLNDNSKAFDLYERCYLAQPERKGVLLDICRLLLINDSRLDHVDQRKWLKLAIKTFPSNPIVMNLRDALPLNDNDATPKKITMENELSHKIEKMEQRLMSMEQLLIDLVNNLKVSPVISKDTASTDASEDKAINVVPESPFTLFTNTPKDKPTLFNQHVNETKQMIDTENKPLSIKPVQDANISGSKPIEIKPCLEEKRTECKPVEIKPAQEAQITESKPTEVFPAQKAEITESNPVPEEKQPEPPKPTFFMLKDDKPVSGPTSFPIIEHPKLGLFQTPISNLTTSSVSNPFSFATTSVSGNLFADSLRKFNIPEGSWASGKVQDKQEERDEEDNGDDADNEVVNSPELPIENTCEMKPIEIKSGEEDEDVLFEQRCKLYRFRDKEYKERGLGNVKVLKHRSTGAGRLIMRREFVNRVCLNCWSCSKVERMRDTQVRFAGIDASDGEPEMTVFLAKFKTPEMTDKFITHITELFSDDS